MSLRKTTRKHKLLLDEGLPPRTNYSNLNNFHNVRHITHDYSFMGNSDDFVYKIAKKEQRMIMVLNTKDFKPLLKTNTPSVISLSTNISNEEADLKIMKALKNLSESQTKGNLISISRSGIRISNYRDADII